MCIDSEVIFVSCMCMHVIKALSIDIGCVCFVAHKTILCDKGRRRRPCKYFFFAVVHESYVILTKF